MQWMLGETPEGFRILNLNHSLLCIKHLHLLLRVKITRHLELDHIDRHSLGYNDSVLIPKNLEHEVWKIHWKYSCMLLDVWDKPRFWQVLSVGQIGSFCSFGKGLSSPRVKCMSQEWQFQQWIFLEKIGNWVVTTWATLATAG